MSLRVQGCSASVGVAVSLAFWITALCPIKSCQVSCCVAFAATLLLPVPPRPLLPYVLRHDLPLRITTYHDDHNYLPRRLAPPTAYHQIPLPTTTYHDLPVTTYHYLPLPTATYQYLPLPTTTYHCLPPLPLPPLLSRPLAPLLPVLRLRR